VSKPSTTALPSDFARPLETYHREALVQDLLESWRHLPARIVLQKLDTGVREGGIPNEAYVAVARALIRAGADDEAWRVVELIARRTAGRTSRHIAVWGLAGTRHQEDLAREIMQMTIESVISTSARDEFWECRFWTCFDRRARTILRDFRCDRTQEASWDEWTDNGGKEPANGVSHGVSSVDWVDSLAARSALARLPEPLRTAFYLKHYAGYKEESRTAEATVASALGVSGRSVRNYLQRAEQLLAEWRAEEIDNE
jgi:DNA-directed RNA polymerase specialized sigma24 family protein